jgi:hypothetical protein
LLLCRKKKFVEERERPEGEERESCGGYLVVVLASCGGAGGGEACGGSGWWLEQRGERGREKYYKNGAERLVFFLIFGPNFLLSQVINGASIYRWWKRIISSTPGQNFSPRFGWEGSQPLVQSSVPELTSSRRRRCRCAVFHPETVTWGCRGTAGDPFRASFVRFDGEIKH